MSITQQSIIDFLNSRSSETKLDATELEAFISELKSQIDRLSVQLLFLGVAC